MTFLPIYTHITSSQRGLMQTLIDSPGRVLRCVAGNGYRSSTVPTAQASKRGTKRSAGSAMRAQTARLGCMASAEHTDTGSGSACVRGSRGSLASHPSLSVTIRRYSVHQSLSGSVRNSPFRQSRGPASHASTLHTAQSGRTAAQRK